MIVYENFVKSKADFSYLKTDARQFIVDTVVKQYCVYYELT